MQKNKREIMLEKPTLIKLLRQDLCNSKKQHTFVS